MSVFALPRTALRVMIATALLFAAACDHGRTRQVDALFERWNRSDSPGCSLGIVRGGHLIYESSYGLANLEHQIPITPETIFRIASVSKQFTAMGILLLEQDGLLSLDDDIRTILPAMPDYGRPITLRHLMQHSSGMRDYIEVMYLMGARDDDKFFTREVMGLLARQDALNFLPGKRYLYSNSGYLVLGEIVAQVSGLSLRRFTDERILRPLGMRTSSFHDDHTEIVARRASGYAPRAEGGFRLAESHLDLVGDGSLFTTVRDLFLWDQNFYHQQIGGEQVAAAQHETLVLDDGRQMTYAAGLEISSYGGLPVVAHSGSWVGFTAEILRFPEQHFSVICLCNDESADPTALAFRIADLYLGEQFEALPKTSVPIDAPDRFATPPRELNAKQGLYREPVTHTVARVKVAARGLVLDLGWEESAFIPIDRNRFRSASPDGGLAVDMVFSDEREEVPERFTLITPGEMPLDFEKIEVATLSPEKLREYAGSYYSEELGVTHRIVFESGHLFAKYRNASPEPLVPTLEDHFVLGEKRIEFERDTQGRVSSFGAWSDRAWNLRFVRLAD